MLPDVAQALSAYDNRIYDYDDHLAGADANAGQQTSSPEQQDDHAYCCCVDVDVAEGVGRRTVVEVGGAQVVYLVAFAATFFLEGVTGLAVTLLSVATLFVVMQATGRIDWEAVLARPDDDLEAARREHPAVAV